MGLLLASPQMATAAVMCGGRHLAMLAPIIIIITVMLSITSTIGIARNHVGGADDDDERHE